MNKKFWISMILPRLQDGINERLKKDNIDKSILIMCDGYDEYKGIIEYTIFDDVSANYTDATIVVNNFQNIDEIYNIVSTRNNRFIVVEQKKLLKLY